MRIFFKFCVHIIYFFIPISCSDFYRSEHSGLTGKDLNERAMDST